MRYFFYFWLLPLGLFWGWYGLSYYDQNMGIFFFTRELHDEVFRIYSEILRIPAEDIAPMAAKACVLDTFIVLGIVAIRHRKSWFPALAARFSRNELATKNAER